MSIMETMERKQPRARRSFTPEFKAEIVQLCQRGDRSIGQVARDFDLTETAVREWVRQAERDAGTRGDGGLTNQERQELSALRRENGGCVAMWRSSSERRLLRVNARMRSVRWGSLVSSLPQPEAGGLSSDVRPHRTVRPGSVCGLIGACLVPN
jgi:transposase